MTETFDEMTGAFDEAVRLAMVRFNSERPVAQWSWETWQRFCRTVHRLLDGVRSLDELLYLERLRDLAAEIQRAAVDAESQLREGVQEIPKDRYRAYRETEHWRTFRQVVRDFWDSRCAVCNASDRIEVHHRTYERVDLATLHGAERLTDCGLRVAMPQLSRPAPRRPLDDQQQTQRQGWRARGGKFAL